MIKRLLGALALTALFAVQAHAATMTITGPSEVVVGQGYQMQIFGNFEPDGLIAGGITVLWDAALVQLNGITLNLPVVADFSCPGSVNCPPPGPGSAAVVWGEFLSDLIPAGASGNVLMATLDFTALNDGVAVFDMENNSVLTGGWFGAGFVPIADPTFGTASVLQTVPLPAAVWFMIGGLGTLLGFRRK